MHKPKHPISRYDPSALKSPRTAAGVDFYSTRPSWRIHMLEFCDPFGWHQVDGPTLEKIRERLKCFERMTWNEILNEGKKRNHFIQVEDMCKEARNRLAELKQDDVDQLLSLALAAKGRIWGILENSVVRLLWWDPEHDICPSHKKHT